MTDFVVAAGNHGPVVGVGDQPDTIGHVVGGVRGVGLARFGDITRRLDSATLRVVARLGPALAIRAPIELALVDDVRGVVAAIIGVGNRLDDGVGGVPSSAADMRLTGQSLDRSHAFAVLTPCVRR